MSNTLEVWDSTIAHQNYPNKIKKIFDSFYHKERKNFTNWIGLISKKFSKDIDWWVSLPPSRNPYASKIYSNICIFYTVKKLGEKKILPNKIILDSNALKKIIEKWALSKNIKVDLSLKLSSKFKFLYLFKYIKSYIFFVITFIISKVLLKKIFLPKKPINIIDTFVIDEKINSNFYYGKLIQKYLKNYNNIFFVPTIIKSNLIEYLKILISLNKNRKYIFKEKFLSTQDLLYCFFYLIRKKKFIRNHEKFKNLDLSLLVNEEIKYNKDFKSTLLALSNFCFAKRLYDKKIFLKKIINWFENQVIDKGWNFGFRKFYPNVYLLGYQGFTTYPEYMCTHPARYEEKAKVIPKQIIVIGKKYVKTRKEFFSKANIVVGPALRFDKLYMNKSYNKKYDIVIFLNGANKLIDFNTIQYFLNINPKIKNLKIYIKSHPILPLSKIISKKKLPENFLEIKGKFSDIITHTKIAVSYGPTSATLESLAYGCKLIVPFSDSFDKSTLKSLNIPKNSYKVCENQNQLVNAINFFYNNLNKKKLNNNNYFKRKLFEKISKKNLKLFI